MTHKTAETNLMKRRERVKEHQQRIDLVIDCLRQDARMTLTKISEQTKIPISSIFDMWPEVISQITFTVKRK